MEYNFKVIFVEEGWEGRTKERKKEERKLRDRWRG